MFYEYLLLLIGAFIHLYWLIAYLVCSNHCHGYWEPNTEEEKERLFLLLSNLRSTQNLYK